MGQIVLLVLTIIAAIAVGIYHMYKKEEEEKISRWWWLIPLSLLVLTFLVGGIFTIPAGNRGVLLRFSKVAGVYGEGLNVKIPLIDRIALMNVQTQLYSTEATAASKDLQDVTTSIGLNYKIDPSKAGEIYRTLGEAYIDKIAAPAIQEVVKATTARYNAEDMILMREIVKADIASALTERLAERSILAEIVSITNFEFSDEFTTAIENKVVAQQNVIQAQYVLEKVKIEAQQILVKAQAQDQANQALAEHMTPELLQYILIDRLGSNVKVIVIPSGQGLTIGGLEELLK